MTFTYSLIGKTFGKLTVIKQLESKVVGKTKQKQRVWLCSCSCGNTTKVTTTSLRCGITKSCGCYAKEQRLKAHKTHGLSDSRLYVIRKCMLRRCYSEGSPGYSDYGGRGITVCDDWKNDFMSFYNWAIKNGYNDTLSIDRIDVNGNYCPENCRWATAKQQSENKRTNVNYLLNGKKIGIMNLLRETKYPQVTYYRHLRQGKKDVKDLFSGLDFSKYTIERLK